MKPILAIALLPAAASLLGSTEVYERPPDPPREVISAVVTAYTSDPLETDDTPTITASGSTTRDGVAANNCLPFGTHVLIGGKEYAIEDRMNRKYGCERFDVWMAEKADAIRWGVRELEAVVL